MPKKRKQKVKEKIGKPEKSSLAENQNKMLKNFFIGIVLAMIFILAIGLFFKSLTSFDYRDVKFDVVKEGSLVFYQTSFPVFYNESRADYNIYLRNDPRKLEREIPFEGTLELKKMVVLNSTNDFNCDGDGIIAIGNLIKLQIFGMQIIKDSNASCSQNGEYMFVNIQEGNGTGIEQVGPSCYNINVNNCEILKGTERFMNEAFVEIKKATQPEV